MKRFFMCAVLAVAVFSGCSGYRPPVYSQEEYPNRYSFYDLRVDWKLHQRAEVMQIAGFVKNTRYAYLRGLELTASVRNGGGESIGEGTFLFFPHQVDIDETVPFELNIPLTRSEKPVVLKFTYRYRLAERTVGDTLYSHSFETKIP